MRARQEVARRRLRRTSSGPMTPAQLERWAEAAIVAAEPDRVERLERQVAALESTLGAMAVLLNSHYEHGREHPDREDIACPCCGVHYTADELRDHVADPPDFCDRVRWENRAHGRR